MFDKVDVRIPWNTPFSEGFQKIIDVLKQGPIKPFRPSRYYRYVGDLRKDYATDAVLHLEYKFGECTHKLEIIDAGKKTLGDIHFIVRQIFDVDPSTLELMRLDLTADVCGVPVSWFRENARVEFKRFSSRIDKADDLKLEFIGMNSAHGESVYAGRRPNCIRIYDKFAELRVQWRKMEQSYARFNKRMDSVLPLEEGEAKLEFTGEERYFGPRIAPPFTEFCKWEGYEYREGEILTRVERQIGGDRFPKGIYTLGDLQKLPTFNPFSSIRLLGSENTFKKMPSPDSLAIRDYLAVMGLQQLIKETGSAQAAYGFVKKNGRGNGKRILENLVPHLPVDGQGITEKELFELYRKSVSRQIGELPGGAVYLPPRYGQKEIIAESGP